jgi:hypothetical protein
MNVFDLIPVNSEAASNEINESDWQSEKHPEQRTRAWRGIFIDLSEGNENACDSTRVNSYSVSNATNDEDEQNEKDHEHGICT